jgi:hypothetical protein
MSAEPAKPGVRCEGLAIMAEIAELDQRQQAAPCRRAGDLRTTGRIRDRQPAGAEHLQYGKALGQSAHGFRSAGYGFRLAFET